MRKFIPLFALSIAFLSPTGCDSGTATPGTDGGTDGAGAGGSMSFAGAPASGGSLTDGAGGNMSDGSGCPGLLAEYKVALNPSVVSTPVVLLGCCLPSALCGLVLRDGSPPAFTPIPVGCAPYGSFGIVNTPPSVEGAGFVGVPHDPHRACTPGDAGDAGRGRDAGQPLDAGPPRDAAFDAQ